MIPAGIKPYQPDTPWQNCHENFSNNFTPDCSWILDHADASLSESDLYKRATENLKWVIGQSIEKSTTLRAIGANWSFSPVAMCNGGMLQTKGLDLIFNINETLVSPSYLHTGKTHQDLIFAECGTQIARLNRALEIEHSPARMHPGIRWQQRADHCWLHIDRDTWRCSLYRCCTRLRGGYSPGNRSRYSCVVGTRVLPGSFR